MRMSERELERLAAHLGEEAAQHLDVDRVAASVTARLRAAGPVTARPATRWLAAAAAVALMAGAAWFTFARDSAPPMLGAGPALLPGLHELSSTELHQVLDSLAPVAPVGLDHRVTLDDLDAEQLETLLLMMEG